MTNCCSHEDLLRAILDTTTRSPAGRGTWHIAPSRGQVFSAVVAEARYLFDIPDSQPIRTWEIWTDPDPYEDRKP